MSLTNDGAEAFYESGIIAATLYAGLHEAQPTSGNEIDGTGYSRLTLGTARWDVDDNVASMNADLEWEDAAQAALGDPTHIGLWTTSGGGTLIFWGEFGTDTPAITIGTRIFTVADAITLTLPTGDLTIAGAERGFNNGLLSSTVYAALHSADPSSSNELSGSDYARLTLGPSRWDIMNNTASLNADLTWDADVAEDWGDPTHVGFWTASTGGTLLFKGDVSQDVPAITDGTRVFVEEGDFALTLPLAA